MKVVADENVRVCVNAQRARVYVLGGASLVKAGLYVFVISRT